MQRFILWVWVNAFDEGRKKCEVIVDWSKQQLMEVDVQLLESVYSSITNQKLSANMLKSVYELRFSEMGNMPSALCKIPIASYMYVREWSVGILGGVEVDRYCMRLEGSSSCVYN